MLIVTLPLTSLAPSGAPAAEMDYALTHAGFALGQHGCASLALLARSEQTALMVPAGALSWHPVNMPRLSRGTSQTKVRTVLDGLMEDQILDEPAQMHLALWQQTRKEGDKQHWVAACDKAWLTAAIQAFQAAGHRVVSIWPQAMPWTATHQTHSLHPQAMCSVHFEGTTEQASLILCDAQGVLCAPAQAASALLDGIRADTTTAATAEPAVAALAEALIAKHLPDTKLSIHSRAQHMVEAARYAQDASCDLAQFDMSVAGSARWLQKLQTSLRDWLTLPVWRPARIALAALVVAHIAGLNAWAWKEKTALSDKRARIQQLLTQTFPQVKVIVDAPVQMQRELAILSQASGALTGRDMELLLARYAAVFPNAPPTAIDYASGELSIKGSGIAADQLGSLAGKLQSVGIRATLQGDKLMVSEISTDVRTVASAAATAGGKP